MKEDAMKMRSDMATEKPHFQIKIHMKECMTAVNDMVKVYIGNSV